jgi:hypothetical protein
VKLAARPLRGRIAFVRPYSSVSGATSYAGTEMANPTTTALYVVLMAAAIVAIDFLFFKHRFWERLIVNVGIVLVFAAFYFRFLKRP